MIKVLYFTWGSAFGVRVNKCRNNSAVSKSPPNGRLKGNHQFQLKPHLQNRGYNELTMIKVFNLGIQFLVQLLEFYPSRFLLGEGSNSELGPFAEGLLEFGPA